jgi:oligosaccharide repeat unit polymerase
MQIEVFYKILSVIISLGMIVNGYVIKKEQGTWLTPSGIFSLFWFIFTFLPLIILVEIPVNPLAVLFITVSVILFSWTSFFFRWNKAFELNKQKLAAHKIFDTKFLRFALWFSIIVATYSTIAQVLAQGFTLGEMINHPLLTSGKYTQLRYEENIKGTIFNGLSTLFSYLGVLIAGLIFGSSLRKKIKRLSLLCFLPPILIMFTQGAKGLLFLALFFFLGSLMVSSFYNNKVKLFNFKNNAKIFKVSLLIFVGLYFSFLSRGLQNVSDFGVLVNRLRRLFGSYMFAHLYSFSDWFTSYLGGDTGIVYDTSNNYFGFYTYYFLGKYFVPKEELIIGTYDEYYIFEDILQSNIYTIFRGLIQDFTLIGALIFITINGFLLHLIFYQFLIKKKPIISAAFCVFMLGYIYNSLYISLLTWNIPIVLFVFFVIVLYINKYKLVFKGRNLE